jgi:hypothetical protein
MSSSTVVTTVSRQQVAEAREEREKELQRLAWLAGRSCQGSERDSRVADLLAFLEVIHDTPVAKVNWISRT